jgi:hypothetical protein
MAFTVVGRRREQAALVEIHVQIELAFARGELGRELDLIGLVDRFVERAEIFLDRLVERVELRLHYLAICVVGGLRGLGRGLGAAALPHRLTVIAEAHLRRGKKCVRINRRRPVGLGLHDCRQRREMLCEGARQRLPSRLQPCFHPVWSKNSSDRLFMRPLDDNNAGACPIARGIGRTALDRGPGSEEIAGRCPFLGGCASLGSGQRIRSGRAAANARERE